MLEEEKIKERERKLKICEGCELNNNGVCDSSRYIEREGVKVYGCGCILKLKALSSSKCPLGKW